MRKPIIVEGAELKRYRRDYTHGYDVFLDGAKAGLVRPLYGRRQYKPQWEAVLVDGTPCGNPQGTFTALLYEGDAPGGLWDTRKAAVAAIVERCKAS